MKVAVLTTSYPRYEGDPAGNFVADAVEQLRARGVEVDVVSPASFRHFGIAYGSGVVGNLRRAPWKGLLLPAMLGSFAQAARRAARDADLVHAHWLPAGAVALTTGKPFVVQLWGTDVELARRAKPDAAPEEVPPLSWSIRQPLPAESRTQTGSAPARRRASPRPRASRAQPRRRICEAKANAFASAPPLFA